METTNKTTSSTFSPGGIQLTKDEPQPLKNFAKKDTTPVDPVIARQIVIPPIYYWEDVYDGKSCLMTMAFQIHGKTFGLSYPIEDDNKVRINILRQKLFNVVKESLDVLVHHGLQVLDSFGNIDLRKVNEQEASRYRFDQFWDRKVKAFNKLVRIAPITRAKAVKLGLLDKPKTV